MHTERQYPFWLHSTPENNASQIPLVTHTPWHPTNTSANPSLRSGGLSRGLNLTQGIELGVDSNYNTLYLCLAISGLQLVFLQFPWKRSVSLIDVASGPSCDSLTNAVSIAWRRKSRRDFFLALQTKRSEPGRPNGRATFTEGITQTELGIGPCSRTKNGWSILKDGRLPNLSQLTWGSLNDYS